MPDTTGAPKRDICPMILSNDTICDIPKHERSTPEQRDMIWTFSASSSAFDAVFHQQHNL